MTAAPRDHEDHADRWDNQDPRESAVCPENPVTPGGMEQMAPEVSPERLEHRDHKDKLVRKLTQTPLCD